VAIVVGAITVGRTFLAHHYFEQGKRSLRTDPVQAIKKANDSLAYNRDSLQALYLKSAGYARLGDYQRSRATLLDATRLEPRNFLSWSLLGDLEVRRGDLRAARAAYVRASRLNPRDRTLQRLKREPRP
jgi:tetratricopeptide (TPR) repeat protein